MHTLGHLDSFRRGISHWNLGGVPPTRSSHEGAFASHHMTDPKVPLLCGTLSSPNCLSLP